MKKKKTPRSFADAIKASIVHAAQNPPKKSWFSRLPPEAKADLLDLKRRWQAGEYEGVELSVIHRGVVARCKEASWPIPKSDGTLANWLRQ